MTAQPTEDPSDPEPYALVDGQDRLLRDDLLRCFRDPRFERVDLLVSFGMKSGLEQVHGGLVDALDRGAKAAGSCTASTAVCGSLWVRLGRSVS